MIVNSGRNHGLMSVVRSDI